MREGLRTARLASGYSVTDIARLLKVTPSVYYKWEYGSRDPMLGNAWRLSLLLCRSLEELFFTQKVDKKTNKKYKT